MSCIVTVAALLAAVSFTTVAAAEEKLTLSRCYPGTCNSDNCFSRTSYTLGVCEKKVDELNYQLASLNETTKEWTIRSFSESNCTGYVLKTLSGVMDQCKVTEYSSARVDADLAHVRVCGNQDDCSSSYCDLVSVSASSGECKKVNPKSIFTLYYVAKRKTNSVEFRLHPSPKCEGTRYFEADLTPEKKCVSFKKEATIASGCTGAIPLFAALLTVLVSIVWSG